jgi:hypothetical protein
MVEKLGGEAALEQFVFKSIERMIAAVYGI